MARSARYFLCQPLVKCAPVGKAGQGIGLRLHRQLLVQLRQPAVQQAQLLFVLHQLADVEANGHHSAVAHAPLIEANPAVFGDLVYRHLGRIPALVHSAFDPGIQLFGRLQKGQAAARGVGSHHLLECRLLVSQLGQLRIHLQVRAIDHDQPILGVVELESRGQCFNRGGQPFTGLFGIAARRLDGFLLCHQLADIDDVREHAAVWQAQLGNAPPFAIGHVAHQAGVRASEVRQAARNPRLFPASGVWCHAIAHHRAQQLFVGGAGLGGRAQVGIEAEEMTVAEHDATVGVEQHEAGLQSIEHLLLRPRRGFGAVERARQHQHDGQQHQRDRGTELAVVEPRRQARNQASAR